MFDQHIWRQQLTDYLAIFARHPIQEMQLAGSPGVLPHLALRTLTPFLNALHAHPVDAVVTLAAITHDTGANLLVRQVMRVHYPTAKDLDRIMRASTDLCITIERLLVELQTIPLALRRLNAQRSVWLRNTLKYELDAYPWSFVWIRDLLRELNGQDRIDALRRLRSRNGRYTGSDLTLIESALSDANAQTRAYAARLLGVMVGAPPPALSSRLLEVALRDSDAETRFAAARALGLLRERAITSDALAYIESHLIHEDSFYRSSAALLLGQLGEHAGKPTVVRGLCDLLRDRDAYTREAAARALGRIGPPAALPEVIEALERATQDDDVQVHEAATDSLALLCQFAELSVQAA
ncbi:MAG: HEAT repeat domain-containing protein [Roseiflexus sp.]|nr:HEAT repeat domain-containing protein [Roseiflexus sp.]MCS7290627.1 HEAT repeat domain-containing protein [Roseiflexus sp.]MDW8145499.1 HEAT repeat domain-containing protein [Roseiflexaceae bacterium]MDW8231419.1 HEAT repeat domain-containing protein [Roseiflexaceae bacterium]